MNKYLDSIFGKVFGTSPQKVSHKENYTLTDEQVLSAERWFSSDEGTELLKRVLKNYHFKKSQINEYPQVHIFSSKYANGFAVTFEEPFTEESFELLFHSFAARCLKMGYKKVSLDRKIEEQGQQIIEIEKFYLKPPLQMPEEGELISQLYGNVSVEKYSSDNRPSYLKLLVTVYSDRLYQDALPFDEFMDHLFDVAND